ncbi:phosphoribosyltransferase [Streptomyces albus subsp. chlorinus]|uniref:phosphoribosyltransferase n=1 Tax=Streptomyces albus TaxID=1888 RepID=UPI001571190D|nr:phosphoribosyltransferase family protein [Streptomyces albus]NSC23116.1 phosphoribosyltransferase [Streptomyces albus subsp. chlorinus]
MRFADRTQAGRELAASLAEMQRDEHLPDPLVLALPRGGVPVAVEVARALRAPLDVLVARKIGLPGRPEYGIGAIAGEDPPVWDRTALHMLGMTEDRLSSTVARERTELHRREDLYRGGRPAPRTEGRAVIVVDDGLATGVTARAALRHLRRQGPARLVLAAPVGAGEAVTSLGREADTVLCLHQPEVFEAVGLWYRDFPQTTDEEVTAALDAFARSGEQAQRT